MNGILIINKPAGWTSHDVVAKLRGITRERRIGHGGTLDPMATGVLPVFIGRATRAVSFCESADKTYIAGLRLGITTDTQDTTGRVLAEDDSAVPESAVRAAIRTFVGHQSQIPPMYSAVKIGGKKLYEIARKGAEIPRPPRAITIHALEVIGAEQERREYTLKVVCSKGTYVRTLCHDIGQKLGCGGALCALHRTRAGSFSIEDAVTLEQVESAARASDLEQLLIPVDRLFSECPPTTADPEQERICRSGGAFSMTLPAAGRYRVYSESGTFLMLGEYDGSVMKTVKSFFEVD